MTLAQRVARKYLASVATPRGTRTRVATLTSTNTLHELVKMEVESDFDGLSQAEQWKATSNVKVTPAVQTAAHAFDSSVKHVLTEWCSKNMAALAMGEGPLEHAKTAADVVDVMMKLRGGAGYLYFMEHEGHGVGTWDGDWDVLFKDSNTTIENLSKHVLGATNPQYKALQSAIQDAAYEARPDEPGTEKSARTRRQAGAGEAFQKVNPKITDEQVERINAEHEKHRDKFKTAKSHSERLHDKLAEQWQHVTYDEETGLGSARIGALGMIQFHESGSDPAVIVTIPAIRIKADADSMMEALEGIAKVLNNT